jgi:hypothetical protein
MPTFRVKDPKGADVVVRYAGRRLRVTREWTVISEDAVVGLLAEAGKLLEQKGEQAPPPAAEKPKPRDKPKGKPSSADRPGGKE